jgi:hypothetical protein
MGGMIFLNHETHERNTEHCPPEFAAGCIWGVVTFLVNKNRRLIIASTPFV